MSNEEEPTEQGAEEQKTEKISVPDFCSKLAERLSCATEYFENVGKRKLPVSGTYISVMADWLEEDYQNLVEILRKLVDNLRVDGIEE